jgi:hypothetical protein
MKTLGELLEHWLQERPATLGAALIGEQSGEIGRGAQLPCACAVTPPQLERLHQEQFRIVDVRLRH